MQIPIECTRLARRAGHLEPRTSVGDIRERLLLASPQGLRSGHDSEKQQSVLEGQIRDEPPT
jgi:hypothetical protein